MEQWNTRQSTAPLTPPSPARGEGGSRLYNTTTPPLEEDLGKSCRWLFAPPSPRRGGGPGERGILPTEARVSKVPPLPTLPLAEGREEPEDHALALIRQWRASRPRKPSALFIELSDWNP
jgi:hypothetical protein